MPVALLQRKSQLKNRKRTGSTTRKYKRRTVTRKQRGGNDCASLGAQESDSAMNAFINVYSQYSGNFTGVCQFKFNSGPAAGPTIYIVYITPIPGRIGGYCLKGNVYEFGYLVNHTSEGQVNFAPYGWH